ncbi:MAG: hypothetical protein AAFY59_16730, partial [Pseudomonadota bacterium]
HSRLSRILKSLAQQRASLVSGRLDTLAPHTRLLQDVLSQIEGMGPTAGKTPDAKLSTLLEACKSAAEENLALLEASQKGVKAAQDHVRSITEAVEQLSTYSGTGERRNLVPSTPRMEKRS